MKRLVSTSLFPAHFLPALLLALAAIAGPAPALAADVAHLSGGIGLEEREMLKSRAGEFNLRLSFAEAGGGHYLAGVRVAIDRIAGERVLTVDSAGPWLYAALPPGRYRVTADAEGRQQTRTVNVAGRRPSTLHFYWP